MASVISKEWFALGRCTHLTKLAACKNKPILLFVNFTTKANKNRLLFRFTWIFKMMLRPTSVRHHLSIVMPVNLLRTFFKVFAHWPLRITETTNFCMRICGNRGKKLRKCGIAYPPVTPPRIVTVQNRIVLHSTFDFFN